MAGLESLRRDPRQARTRVPRNAACLLCAAVALAAALPPVASAQETTIRVRPANQPLLDRASALIDRVRTGSERLAARAGKSDELRGKSESLRAEIVELYRAIREIETIADTLLVRGEQDGLELRRRATALESPLQAAVSALRPALGSPQGLINAMIRRAKDQTIPVKQLDGLIHQQKWSDARAKLETLLDDADEVGRFPDPKEAEQLYRPLFERAAQIRPGYLAEQHRAELAALRDEFQNLRPDLATLLNELTALSAAIAEQRAWRWKEQTLSGPELLVRLTDTWHKIDPEVAQAAGVLHAIGSSAETELRSLAADYHAARIRAITLVRELVNAEPASLAAAEVEKRYRQYITTIPPFAAALHAASDELLVAALPLKQLATQSPELTARIDQYREATDEAIRWRKRLADRYQKKLIETAPAPPLHAVLDQPPPLPGQEGPGGLKRTNQMFWSIDQPLEFVADTWRQHWNGLAVVVTQPTVRWPTGADPQLVGPWHRRGLVESTLPRQTLNELKAALADDLLVPNDQTPLTLEAAVAIYSATYGPFRAMAGTIEQCKADNVPDRLWESFDPRDIPGALAPSALATFPAIPALVRLNAKPNWLAHELFVWVAESPKSPPDTPTPKPPITAQKPAAEPPAGDAAPETAAARVAPAAAPNQPGAEPTKDAPNTPNAPAKSRPAQPPGPVPF